MECLEMLEKVKSLTFSTIDGMGTISMYCPISKELYIASVKSVRVLQKLGYVKIVNLRSRIERKPNSFKYYKYQTWKLFLVDK